MSVRRVGWVDATCGVSGDMLLGACLDAGADLELVRGSVASLGLPERITIDVEPAHRGGLGATRALVGTETSTVRRTLADVLVLLGAADPPVGERAAAVFRALAGAEARAHRVPVEQVHFHEVGALDAIADVVAVVAALASLGLDELVGSPVALGGGRARTAHGSIPVPGPAVLELLASRGAPGVGGPIDVELATPTGVALLVTTADRFGPMPALRATAIGTGAGGRDPEGHPNVTRLVVGEIDPAVGGRTDGELGPALLIETNVDDLDPRLWPAVLADLLGAGASDAWLTPILMKKGRPAHTLSVLCPADLVERLERVVFTRTSTIGLRRTSVTKRALPREVVEVDVPGGRVRLKVVRLDGEVVSATPEHDDVARLARELDASEQVVLDRARAAASTFLAD